MRLSANSIALFIFLSVPPLKLKMRTKFSIAANENHALILQTAKNALSLYSAY